jgi:hypothetical protein
MSSMRGTYGAALRITMRNTAAAYGFTLATSATLSLLTEVTGKPDALKLFLFAIGGVVAFVLLEAVLAPLRTPAQQQPLEHAIPFAGALNAVSVCAALGITFLIVHFVRSSLAWFLAQMCTTAIYMLVVAVEITVAAAVQGRASRARARKSSVGLALRIAPTGGYAEATSHTLRPLFRVIWAFCPYG